MLSDPPIELMRDANDGRGETLLLFPGALGDAVCLEPAVAHLAQAGPVTLYARGAAAEVAALFPSHPAVRSLDSVDLARLFSLVDDVHVDEWLQPFARIVSFTGAGVAAVVARLGATGRAVVAPFPRPPLAMHAAEYFLRVASGEPAAVAPAPRLVPLGGYAREVSPRSSRLAVLPGSAAAAKRAAHEIFAGLASRWCAAAGEAVVVLGPAEEGSDGDWGSLGRVVRPQSIAELAACLTSCVAFVGNDSGPSHVAAALGVPGVVIFTTTDPAHFGPRGARVTSARATSGGDVVWRVLRRALP